MMISQHMIPQVTTSSENIQRVQKYFNGLKIFLLFSGPAVEPPCARPPHPRVRLPTPVLSSALRQHRTPSGHAAQHCSGWYCSVRRVHPRVPAAPTGCRPLSSHHHIAPQLLTQSSKFSFLFLCFNALKSLVNVTDFYHY